MKKLILFFTAIVLMIGSATISAKADNGIYINASFDDGINPFTVTENEGNVSIVDANTEGIGEEKGKVLKLTSNGSDNFMASKAFEEKITEIPVIMEARFLSSSENGVRRIFALKSSAPSRSRTHGIATIRKNTNISAKPLMVLSQNNDSDSHAFSGDSKSGHLTDENAEAVGIHANTWYKIRFMYYIKSSEAVLNFELYDDSGNLITSEEKSIHTLDAEYPLQDITAIGFGVRGWGSDETIYIDDVVVKSAKTIPVSDGKYIDASFEDGINPFLNITNNSTGKGSIDIVNAASEGVGNGKVLKVTSGTNNSFDAKAELETPLSNSGAYVFETKFLTKSDGIIQRLFTLNSSGNRNKDTGLLSVRRIGKPYYASVGFPSMPDNNITDYLKEVNTEEPFILSQNKWYKIRIFFKASSKAGGENISSIQIFDENDILINSGSNFGVQNQDFPLPDIKYAGFGTKAWNTSQTFYLDDIKIYKSENDKDIIKSAREGIRMNEYAALLSGGTPYLNVLRGFTCIPSAEELMNSSFKRPRIIANEDIFSAASESDDDFVKHLNKKLLKYGDELVLKKAEEIGTRDKLAYSRFVLDRSITLSYLYRITKNEKYIAPLESQLVVAAEEFLGWEYWSYLQSGEMLTALAVGYDWCFDKLSDSAKKKIEACVLQRLEGALSFYEPDYNYIAMQENNWNPVCNGGNLIAALAFMESSPELCAKVAGAAIDASQLGFASVATGGGFKEGPGYWAYNMQYASYIMSTLESIFGSDFGLGDIPGFEISWKQIIYNASSDFSCFNYSDVSEGPPQGVWNYYLGKRFDWSCASSYARVLKPFGIDGYNSWQGSYVDVMSALWNQDITKSYKTLPKNHVADGEMPIASFRESWSSGSLFVAMKGGKAYTPHGSIEAGSFVLDSDGVRWASDFGSEDYSSPGYSELDTRVRDFYTQRAEGHNTISVNPTRDFDQDIYGCAALSDSGENYAVFDMTELFPNDVKLAERRLEFDSSERRVTITDEITPTNEADIYWFMQTRQNAVLENGGREIKLTSDDKVMRLTLVEPENAVFSVKSAQSLFEGVTSYLDLSDVKQISIHLKTNSKTNINVAFSPEYEKFEIIGTDGFDIAESYKEVPKKMDIILSKKISESELSKIKVINEFGNEVPAEVKPGVNPFTVSISFPDGLAHGMYYAIDLSETVSSDGTKASGKTKASFALDADNGNIFSYTAEENSSHPVYDVSGNAYIETNDFLNGKSYAIRHFASAGNEKGGLSGFIGDEFYGKSMSLSAQITSSRRRSEKRVFTLYDESGKVITNGLFRIIATPTDEAKWNSSNISAMDGTYFYDKTGERYLMDTNVPHLFRAVLDISGNNVKIRLFVTNLETFESLEKELSYNWRTFPKTVEISQTSSEDDATFADNFKAFSADSAIDISENGAYIVIDSRNELPQSATLYKALFSGQRFLGTEKEEINILYGKTSVLREENYRYFIWDKNLKPLGEIKE